MDNSSSFEKSSHTVTRPSTPVNRESHPPESAKRTLVKAAGIVSLMTLTSRVLGMIRDIVTAGRFGTSWQWDAFIYAFMLPNFFRRLVGEGALSNAFIPVYSRTLHTQGKEAAFRFANVMATVLSLALVVFMLVVEVVLHYLYHADFLSERLHLTVDLLRIFFPYLFFISIFALAMGILNCHQHFFTPSLGPVILDIAWIAGVLWIVPHAGSIPQDQLRALAIVLLISGVVQVAVEIIPLKKMGLQFQWLPDFSDPNLQKTFQLILPAVMSFAIVQVNMLVDMVLGYFIGPGANSSLWYGTRLMQFPLGVFGIAMGTALLPTISAQIARKEMEASQKTMSFALRSVALILLPCTVGLMVMGKPIIQLLFERGEFDAVSTARTASVLFFYSIGLLAYSGEKMIATGFFAAHDMKTPMVMGALTLIFDTILNLILMQFLREGGLALATSIASIVEFSVLLYLYQKKISGLPIRAILYSYLKIFGASLAMGVVAYVSYQFFSAHFSSRELFDGIVRIFGSISIAVISYIVFCFMFRVAEMKEAFDFIRKKRSKK